MKTNDTEWLLLVLSGHSVTALSAMPYRRIAHALSDYQKGLNGQTNGLACRYFRGDVKLNLTIQSLSAFDGILFGYTSRVLVLAQSDKL